MFHHLSLENKYLDVSNFDTSSATNIRRMFYGTNIKYLDLSNFNTSNVTDMSEMFMGSRELKYLDLSSFDVSNVSNKTDMLTATHGIEKAYAKDEETANFFNNGTNKPSTYKFVVK